jgi:hypothetical protein
MFGSVIFAIAIAICASLLGVLLELLFVVMCVLCVVQPTSQRIFAASAFVFTTILHDVLFYDLDGFLYYGSAACGGLLAAILMTGINPIPKIILKLQIICIISSALNFFGYVIWFFYFPPLFYNLAFICLYLYTVFILVSRDESDVGGVTIRNLRACFHFSHHPLFFSSYKHKDKI